MSLIENIWILTTIVIVFFVLSTDPKNASNGGTSNNIFSNVGEGQNSVRSVIWVTIFFFYTLSLLISYY